MNRVFTFLGKNIGRYHMKKWYPFVILVVAIVFLVIFMIFTGQTNEYIPTTSDPAVVYQEACQECHGVRGEGEGLLYPNIAEVDEGVEEIIEIVKDGALFMPAFPNIPDTTLEKLAEYVSQDLTPRRAR